MNTIALLNDRFRKGDMTLGQYMMTAGVQAQAPDRLLQLIQLVQCFDEFTADNDPYGEHDFGKVLHDDGKYFWKIDYYDPTLTRHSADPTSPNATRRVMTIIRSDGY